MLHIALCRFFVYGGVSGGSMVGVRHPAPARHNLYLELLRLKLLSVLPLHRGFSLQIFARRNKFWASVRLSLHTNQIPTSNLNVTKGWRIQPRSGIA